MSGDGVFHWYWGLGAFPEIYHRVDSRKDALAAAIEAADGGAFQVVEADKELPNPDCFRGDQVLDQYEEHNETCWGEDGPCIVPTAEQFRELEGLLAAALDTWLERHKLRGRAMNFSTMRAEEFYETAADLEDAS